MEDCRLRYLRGNQPNAGEALDAGAPADGGPVVARVTLPTSVPGSRRRQIKLGQEALAIGARLGVPWLFVTMTANPHWPEIAARLEPRQSINDRPEIVCQVFQAKMRILLHGLRVGCYFGARQVYALHVVEFQQRGLPHCHIVVRLSGNPPRTPPDIDR
jgi:hypothetical protein